MMAIDGTFRYQVLVVPPPRQPFTRDFFHKTSTPVCHIRTTAEMEILARRPDPNPVHSLCLLSLNLEQTRAGMYKILGEDVSAQLKAKDTPGVFIQGLVVYSGAGDEVLYERLLDAETVSQVASFCEERGVSLIAYSGDSIVSVCVCVMSGFSAFLFVLLPGLL